MPSAPRPKYVAAKPFSCLSQHYKAGDPVDHPIVLATVTQYGDEFVKAATAATTATKNKEA